MKQFIPPRYKNLFKVLFLLITAGVAIYFAFAKFGVLSGIIGFVFSILVPFLVGGVIAFILKPVCNFFDRVLGDWFVKKVFRKRIASGISTERQTRHAASVVSIVIAMFLLLGIVIGLLAIIIPSLIREVVSLAENLPGYLEQLDGWIATLDAENNMFAGVIASAYQGIVNFVNNVNLEEFFNTLKDNFNDIFSVTSAVISTVVSFLIGILVAVVSAFNILYNRKRFAAQSNMLVYATFKESIANWIIKEAKFADRKFTEFFTGKMLDSFLVGCILFVTFTFVRIPSAALIAIFMAFCNMIPFFGPFIGAVPCGLLVFISDPTNPMQVLTFLIIVIIIQQLDGNILDPYIVGDSVGLSSFWVLFAVILFGDLFGFVGLLIGVPLFAIIYDMIEQLVAWALKRRGKEQLLTDYNFIYHNPEEEKSARKRRIESIKAARMQAKQNDEAERLEAEKCAIAIAEAAEQERLEIQKYREAQAALANEIIPDLQTDSPVETEVIPKEETTSEQ